MAQREQWPRHKPGIRCPAPAAWHQALAIIDQPVAEIGLPVGEIISARVARLLRDGEKSALDIMTRHLAKRHGGRIDAEGDPTSAAAHIYHRLTHDVADLNTQRKRGEGNYRLYGECVGIMLDVAYPGVIAPSHTQASRRRIRSSHQLAAGR